MSDTDTDADAAANFLGGHAKPCDEVMALAKRLARADRIGLALQLLDQLHEPEALTDGPLNHERIRATALKSALWTSKDPDLPTSLRHDRALQILGAAYPLDDAALDGNAEVLGIAGGICKRRWQDLGQLQDLQRAAGFYECGALGPLGDDAYAQINAAYTEDQLAAAGDQPDNRRRRIGKSVRQKNLWASFGSGSLPST